MGCETEFDGHFKLDRDLTVRHQDHLDTDEFWPWVPDTDIIVGESSKAYECEENLAKLLAWLKKNKYVSNGSVEWSDEYGGHGKFVVKDNVMEVYDGVIKYELRAPKANPKGKSK